MEKGFTFINYLFIIINNEREKGTQMNDEILVMQAEAIIKALKEREESLKPGDFNFEGLSSAYNDCIVDLRDLIKNVTAKED